jgi:Tol biopolymer transport system component
MANQPAENKPGPKDVTPSPLDEAAKKAEAAGKAAAPVDAAAAAAAPAAPGAEAAPGEPPEDPGPQNVKDLMKESFLDSKVWNRLFQFLLLAGGIYGVIMSIKGQEFLPWPGILGMLALALTVLFDMYLIKKFRPQAEKIEITARLALSILLGLMMITFIIELFKNLKFPLPVNKNLLWAVAAAAAVVFAINFFMYIAKHKENILADIYMFIAAVSGFIALFIFTHNYVIVSFVFAAISMLSEIASLSKDPLKADERLNTRLFVSALAGLMFLGIFAYSLMIFIKPPMQPIVYGPITDEYKNNKPENLGWSGDSWSFDYSIIDKKSKEARLGIINALSLGITELPAKDQADLKLPQFIDSAVWNRNGSSLIFTASDADGGPRTIWAAALNISLVDQEIEKAKIERQEQEKAAKEAKDRETLAGEVKAELKDRITNLKGGEKSVLNLRTKEDDRLNKPVGKPKVLLASMNLVVDKQCEPVTHRTAWSPDGRKFCFAAKDERSKNRNIWSADVKSQEITRLTHGFDKLYPLWSPSGEKILWCSKTENYSYIRVSNFDGSNAHELSIDNSRDRALFPLWNNSESKVIYIKNGKFIIMNANATKQKALTEATLPNSDYWLTDSKKKVRLGFTESGTIWKVWTMNPTGKKVKCIFTEICEEMTQPKWSYDGKAIALGANYKDGTGSVWRFAKDGKMRTRLFTTKDKVQELEWAYSSERLAFLVTRPSVMELWIIENDGTEPRSLYDSEGTLEHISWNNLGDFIALDETIKRLYFVDPTTTVKVVTTRGDEEVKNLLPYEFYGQYPTWSNDGQVLAYVSWNKYWTPGIGIGIGYGLGNRIWIAQLR